MSSSGFGGVPRNAVEPAVILASTVPRQTAQQRDRVRMARIAEDFSRWALFDQGAGIQHPDPGAHFMDDGEVVADEQNGGCELAAQLTDQIEDLGLYRGIESGRRLVENEQLWIDGQRHGDRYALLHAAR